MQLIKDIIDRKLTMYQEYELKRQYLRSISQFYSIYNLALAVLGRIDNKNDIRIRNKLWVKFLSSTDISFRNKIKKKLQNFIDKNRLVIVEASNIIDDIIESPDYGSDNYIDKSNAVAILSYEYPE